MRRLFGKGKPTPERVREEPVPEPKRDVLPTALKPLALLGPKYGVDHFATPEGKNHLLSELLAHITEPTALLYVSLPARVAPLPSPCGRVVRTFGFDSRASLGACRRHPGPVKCCGIPVINIFMWMLM